MPRLGTALKHHREIPPILGGRSPAQDAADIARLGAARLARWLTRLRAEIIDIFANAQVAALTAQMEARRKATTR